MFGITEHFARERHQALLREAEKRRIAAAAARSQGRSEIEPGEDAADTRRPFRSISGAVRWVTRA